MQARGEPFALVGETVTVTLALSTAADLDKARLRIVAGFLEGGQAPGLAIQGSDGELSVLNPKMKTHSPRQPLTSTRPGSGFWLASSKAARLQGWQSRGPTVCFLR